MPRIRIIAVCVLGLLLAAAAAGAMVVRGDHDPALRLSPALAAQTRADALAGVAKRIYNEEVFGSEDVAAFRVISVLPAVIRGLVTHRPAIARRALDMVPVRHAVHERVTRGSQVLLDVGLKFVVGGQRHPLRAPNGAYIGRMEVSVQDVIGFVKLFHRLTGAEVIVYGRKGHAKSSLPAITRLALPPSGTATIDGHRYTLSSFRRRGFAGEPLGIWILVPAA